MTKELLESLNSFDPVSRREALMSLYDASEGRPADSGNVNLHLHSFFSYNAEGWSPSRIAWEAYNAGLHAVGLCDFDVLDGLEEFTEAGHLLGLRTVVNLETRAFLKEFSSQDINSPGEPGVTYIMGAGFPRVPESGSPGGEGLKGYRDRAQERNTGLISRINEKLPVIALDYARDVLPLSPAGTPTERHIIRAYVVKSEQVHGDGTAAFWAEVTGKTSEEISGLLGTPSIDDLVRSKLAKRGGLGYVQPSEKTFPSADDFITWVLSCEAIPMITWLDGTSGGEKDPYAMFECLMEKGACALNIIPDRNWNISNEQTRNIKVENLRACVKAADDLKLPVNIGTEMNKGGQPFADDLKGEVLSEFSESFLSGTYIMIGQALLARYADFSYASRKACAEFANTDSKNAFFRSVGALDPVDEKTVSSLLDMGPEKALDWFRNSVTGNQ